VAMSAYYALRLYQRTMHNRKPEGIPSREIGWRDGVVLVPLVLCILGLALYPQLILKRTEFSGLAAVAATCPSQLKEVGYSHEGRHGEPGLAAVLTYPDCITITPELAKRIITPAGLDNPPKIVIGSGE